MRANNFIPLSQHQKAITEFAEKLRRDLQIINDQVLTPDNCKGGSDTMIIPIHKKTVTKLLKTGKLPGKKVGMHWFFLKGDFNKYLIGEGANGKYDN